MTAGLRLLVRPYCPLGAADRSPEPSVGLGIEEPGARFGGGFGVPVAWCVGLGVAPGPAVVAVVVGALLQSLSGHHRWRNRRFAFHLGETVSTSAGVRAREVAYFSDIVKVVC